MKVVRKRIVVRRLDALTLESGTREGRNVSGRKQILTRDNCREKGGVEAAHASSASPTFRPFINSNSPAPSSVEQLNVTVVPGRIAFWKVAGYGIR